MIKYIVSEQNLPIFFSCDISHLDVFQDHPKSAGFLVLRYDASKNKFFAKCFGESTSLSIKSKLKHDAKIIEKFLNE
jgi:hypothetical protein